MFRFLNPDYLFLLFSVPLLVLIYILFRISRKKLLNRYSGTDFFMSLMPESSRFKSMLKFIIMMFVIAFLVIALANPQIGSKMEEVKREGVEVIIAVDLSNSMLSEDLKPNRIERAKQSLLKLISNLRNDRIGLIAFAGEAFVQLPLTTDYSAAKLMISTLDPEIIATQGTAIGSAIDLAAKSFTEDDKDERQKVLIIITDGENHEDDAVGASKRAAEQGIIVHTIGMGSLKGGPIPIYRNGIRVSYKKDKDGSIILTKLNASMLEQISSAGNGKFIMSANSDPDLTALIENISELEKTEFDTKIFTDYEDRFQYFIFATLLLMVIEFFINERKNKFITSLNMFAGGKK